MSRETEPTAGAPGGQRGARGGADRATVALHAHRPVQALEPSAGPGPAARSNRGTRHALPAPEPRLSSHPLHRSANPLTCMREFVTAWLGSASDGPKNCAC
jgi:hypothetical protein